MSPPGPASAARSPAPWPELSRSGQALLEMPSGVHLPKWMGIVIEDDHAGGSRCTLEGKPEVMNYRGVFHGGTIATVVDVAMAVAAMAEAGPELTPVTTAVHVDYLQAARQRLVATPTVLKASRWGAVVEATVHDGEGGLVAKAHGTFRFLPADKLVDSN